MSDHDFDRIQPAALDVAQGPIPTAALPQAREGSSAQGAVLLLGGLVLLAAAVVFVLPGYISKSAAPTPRSAEKSAPSNAANAADRTAPAAAVGQSPWQQAQADRERAQSKAALDALLALQYELQERQVEGWAKAEFAAATATAQQGDAAYRESRFAAATALYRDGEAQLKGLRDGIPARLEARLAAADAAFAAGDQAAALSAFGEAAAIEPANERARNGLERAARLDHLKSLLGAGTAQESSGQLGPAAASYREALALDGAWEPARAALAAVEAKISAERSAARVSAGYSALAAGHLEEARGEFRSALALGAGTEAREGLQQAEFQLGQQGIGALLQAATEAQGAEDWKRALQSYEAALAIDASLGPARSGRELARTRLALDEALTRLAAQPAKLASDNARSAADRLIAAAASIPDPGPRLSAQIAKARSALVSMRTEIPVQIRSDGKTDVIVFRVGSLGSFAEKQLSLLPGDYVAVGRRDGYRDVRVEFALRPGAPPLPVIVQCGQQI